MLQNTKVTLLRLGIVALGSASQLAWSQQTQPTPAGTQPSLPADKRARAEIVNELSILMACNVYAAEYDKVPVDLAQIVGYVDFDSKTFISPRSDTKPIVFTAENKAELKQDWHTIAKELEAHCDFVLDYPFQKFSEIEKSGAVIVLYTKTGVPAKEGVAVGFGDGHVEWLEGEPLRKAVEAGNAARKVSGMPLLKVDETGHIVRQ